MFHQLLVSWFHFVEQWGYVGVFLLMALESSIVPIPSEIVMPPAAFWAAQGRMSFWGVVLAGTLGSYFGSIVNYLLARSVGTPLILKYGKYFLINQEKFRLAEQWVNQFGSMGIFVARLLPVVRHLISIPAGVLRMKLSRFSIATITGAGLWCLILSWFGQQVIGNSPELLSSPEGLIRVCREKLQWFVGAVVVFAVLYSIVMVYKRRIMDYRMTSKSR